MEMEGNIIFYTYGSTLELNGQQFDAGRLTEDLLNLSPDDYHPMHERMKRIRTFTTAYEHNKDTEFWWKLNDEMESQDNSVYFLRRNMTRRRMNR